MLKTYEEYLNAQQVLLTEWFEFHDQKTIKAFHKIRAQHWHNMSNPEYRKSAYLYEMFDQEYAFNHEKDFAVLSQFYKLNYHESYTTEDYLNALEFDEKTKQIYRDAKREYYQEIEDWI